MSPGYAKKLGLQIRKTDVRVQKIDRSTLDIFGMVITSFQDQDKLGRARFFQEIFLVTNNSMKAVFWILFLTFSKVDVDFVDRKLSWKTYTAAYALSMTKRVQIINRKKFVKVALDSSKEVFVVYVAFITSEMAIHVARQVQIAFFKAEEAPISILVKYLDFNNVFSKKFAGVLPKHTKIKTHAIDLKEGKQPSYGFIYSLAPIEIKTLKTYIETNLANGFIHPFKSPAHFSILFDQKFNGNLRLCVNYQGLHNLTIKNWYPFPLIGKSRDWVGRAKRFI